MRRNCSKGAIKQAEVIHCLNGGRSPVEFGGLFAPFVLISTLMKAVEEWVKQEGDKACI